MYPWERRAKQLHLDTKKRRICESCRTIDPPTEAAWGCPECGYGATVSELGGEVPKVCPQCSDGEMELITESACAECCQGEVEEREVYPCPYCSHLKISQYEYHSCPNRPREGQQVTISKPDWTPGEGKVAYLRIECRAKEERVRVNGRRCQGWRSAVERFEAGDKDAFRDCLTCFIAWGRNPARVEATEVDFYPHQASMTLTSE